MTAPLLAPSLHAFAVHFGVALLLTSSAFFLIAKLFAARSWAGMHDLRRKGRQGARRRRGFSVNHRA